MRGGGTCLALLPSYTQAIYTDDTTSYVKVNEIYSDIVGAFNANNVNALLKYITGNSSITYENASSTLNTLATNKTTSADIRAKTVTVNGVKKSSSQDVIVRFGGLDWQVVYLSKDTDGNNILTLWLSSSQQDAFAGRSKTEGEYYGFLNNSLYSDWSANWDSTSSNTYQTNIYGTSYIRSVTLNNGGQYVVETSSDSTLSSVVEQNSNSVFARFTMEYLNNSLTSYLVAPINVEWQLYQSATATNPDLSYYYPNDSINNPEDKGLAGEWYTANNCENETGYRAWANDYIWLPSIAETGYSSSNLGLWETSASQRQNVSSTLNADSSVGSGNSQFNNDASNSSFLRSGYFTMTSSVATSLSSSGFRYFQAIVDNTYAVRPALHLNLSKVIEETKPQSFKITLDDNGGSGGAGEIFVSSDGYFSDVWQTNSLSSLSPLPTRQGYSFLGYYTAQIIKLISSSGEFLQSGSYFNSDITLYAYWRNKTQTLTWNGNGTVGNLLPSAYWNFAGSGGYTSTNAGSNSKYTTSTTSVSATSQVNIDEVLGYYAPIPIRRGYTFNGWYTSASGGVKVAGNDGSLLASVSGYTNSSRQWIKESNTTLYAQWTAKSYSIEYDLGLNATISSKPSSYTVNSNTTFDIPTRSGYTFSGYVVELSLDKLYNGFINLQNGTQYYYSDYSKSMYYEYLYMKDEVTYTGTLGNGVILWRTYNSNGSYDQSFSSVTLKGANNYALIVHYLGGSSETSVKFNVSTAFSISDYKLVGDLKITAKWEEDMPAYFDEEGGYWYIENGKMPQSRVADDLKTTLNSKWATLTDSENEYYFAGMTLVSKIYENNEYCKYEDDYYLVEPIRWRLVYSSSQTSGYGTTTDTLAVMAEIVYVDAFSDSYIGAGAGYSSESVAELIKNQIDATYLVSESKSMPTFGSTSLNGTPASVSSNIFVASYDDLSNFTTNKNGTEKLGKIKFSDLAKDYLRANGKDTLYYTRDLGKTYNHIYCMNANGDRVQYKANNLFGVQFTIKVTEYACV